MNLLLTASSTVRSTPGLAHAGLPGGNLPLSAATESGCPSSLGLWWREEAAGWGGGEGAGGGLGAGLCLQQVCPGPAVCAVHWGRDIPPSTGAEAAMRPQSNGLPFSGLSLLLLKMGSFHSTGENHGGGGVRSHEAKQRSSDGGCGGPGLGPPGPGSPASGNIPSPSLQAQGPQVPGEAWFWSASLSAKQAPTSATPLPSLCNLWCPWA